MGYPLEKKSNFAVCVCAVLVDDVRDFSRSYLPRPYAVACAK